MINLNYYSKILFLLVNFITLNQNLFLCQDIRILAHNTSNIKRGNVILELPVDSLIQEQKPTEGISITCNGDIVPVQIVENYRNRNDYLLIESSFQPREMKEFQIKFNEQPKVQVKLTSAYIGEKNNYVKKENIFTEGKFISVQKTKIAPDHVPQDAYYQFEGAGWESDKIAYRIYLDERNKIDIFGKIVPEPVLSKVGLNDLLPGNESYTKMMDWGMDIFKVANTMGIGSFAFYDNGIIPFKNPDSVGCSIINNGDIYSNIYLSFSGIKSFAKTVDVQANISITAGSRLSKVELYQSGDKNICTGLAKHGDTEFLKSGSQDDWQYIGIYGLQSLANDNLGIALFYKMSDLIEQKEDEFNQLVIIKPSNGKVNYYFCAAWEKEPNGIKSIDEFRQFLNAELDKFNNPIKIILE